MNTLDATNEPGWYSCKCADEPSRLACWWSGRKLTSLDDGLGILRLANYTDFVRLVPARDVKEATAGVQAECPKSQWIKGDGKTPLEPGWYVRGYDGDAVADHFTSFTPLDGWYLPFTLPPPEPKPVELPKPGTAFRARLKGSQEAQDFYRWPDGTLETENMVCMTPEHFLRFVEEIESNG